MDDIMKHSRLCRNIRPRKGQEIAMFIVYPLLFLTVMFCGGFCCIIFGSEEPVGALVCGAILLLLLALIGWSSWKAIRNIQRLNELKAQRLNFLNAAELEALEEEIARTEFRYKTFYLLETYLYAPRGGVLIHYANIGSWRTVRHSTNFIPDSAWVELTDKSGVMQKVQVRQWRQYLKEHDDFMKELAALLNRACSNSSPYEGP